MWAPWLERGRVGERGGCCAGLGILKVWVLDLALDLVFFSTLRPGKAQ